MNFIRSLLPFKHYTAILTGTESFRAILAVLFLALVLTIKPAFFIFKDVYPLVQNLESKIINLIDEVYPQELEIKIKNGVASTNVTEPYYISVRQETLANLFSFKKGDPNTQSKVRLLAIDTKGKADEFDRYQSLALLTESSLVYYKDKNVNIYSLRQVKDLTVNKDFIKSKIKEFNKDNKIGNIITIGIFLSPLFMILGIFIFQLFMFLLLTLAVYLMVKINQVQTGFKNTFRYTVAIAFVMTLIWNLISLIPFLAKNIIAAQSLLTIIILGFAYSGIYYIKSHKGNN